MTIIDMTRHAAALTRRLEGVDVLPDSLAQFTRGQISVHRACDIFKRQQDAAIRQQQLEKSQGQYIRRKEETEGKSNFYIVMKAARGCRVAFTRNRGR